jgi:hypothetical protein
MPLDAPPLWPDGNIWAGIADPQRGIRQNSNPANRGQVPVRGLQMTTLAAHTTRCAARRPNVIQFYYSLAPNPMKVALCLEETGLPYELIPVDTRKGEQHAPAFGRSTPTPRCR